jgi:FdhD protein
MGWPLAVRRDAPDLVGRARLPAPVERRRKAMSAAIDLAMSRFTDGAARPGSRTLAEETPVAIVHDASTYAVMMATPQDLEDLAVGFSLTEGVIDAVEEVRAIELVETELGVEARMWLAPGKASDLAARRRSVAGPTGCGLCGVESLAAVQRTPVRPLAAIRRLTADDIRAAMAALEAAQALGQRTRGVHAAGLWRPDQGLDLAREDVGRHNAVDKLAGGLARAGRDAAGVLALTSRVSVELVQKAAAIGAPVIAAVSAPTALAIRTADAAGITLIAVARADGFELFTHPQRIAPPRAAR